MAKVTKTKLLSKPVYVEELPPSRRGGGGVPRHSKWRDALEAVERGRWAKIAEVPYKEGNGTGNFYTMLRTFDPHVKISTRKVGDLVHIYVRRPMKPGRKPNGGGSEAPTAD